MFSKLFERRFENLIVIPFNILYLSAQCPLRFHTSFVRSSGDIDDNDHCKSSHSKSTLWLFGKIPQRFICFILHFLGLFVYANEVVQMHVTRSSRNPIEYLRLFLRACSCLHHINLVHVLWTRKPQFVRVIEHLATKFKHDYEGPLPIWGCIFIPLLFLGVGLASVYILHESPTPEHSLIKVLIGLRSPFFNPSKCNIQNITTELENNTNIESYYTPNMGLSLSYLLFFSRIMLSYITDVIILTSLLALYLPIASFYKNLHGTQIPNQENFYIILKKYSDICVLIELANAAYSRLMLTYVLEAFTFYSVYLKELTVFDGECVFMQCKMGFLFFTFCAVFYLCGEISSLMEKSKFILINQNFTPEMQLLNLINLRIQLSSHSYGISGHGLFLINYSFVTTICSTLLTYFIISVQFQSSSINNLI